MRPLRDVPVDLLAVVVLTVILDVLVLALQGSWVGLLATLPLLYLLPGYTLVASLYPESSQGKPDHRSSGISGLERVALSFGVSLVLVPLIGLVLWPLGVWPSVPGIVVAISVVVGAGAIVGTIRRTRLPPGVRFAVPFERWADGLGRGFGANTPSLDRAINVAVVVSVVLAVGLLGFGLASPQSGGGYTTAALLSMNDDGEMVASGYPTTFVAGEPEPLAIELTNEEGSAETYTVVALVEQVDRQDGETTVQATEQVESFSVSLADGERQLVRHSVAPTTTGDELRLSYYVYKGGASDVESTDDAYRRLYVWISVTNG